MMVFLKNALKQAVVTALTALMSLVGMAVGSAVAQGQKGPEAVSADTWIKICQTDEKTKKEVCQTGYDLRTTTGQILASFVLMEMTGETRKIVRIVVPTGLLLQPGLKVQVDDGKAEDGKFGFCSEAGCFVQMVASDPFASALKKGREIVVSAQNQAASAVTFNFPLGSFKVANEGKAIDEETFRKRQEAIRAQVVQKQQSFEDQLREAQRKAQQGQ
ncbi:invasion associated locus B family protein [Prosthecomicrobium sp. N25]|uniref:invasion associated locus B family protein n=1 Tax=Prosthecomicrobium sp. N25 TaxID=3129254 RepID=UPI00307725B3